MVYAPQRRHAIVSLSSTMQALALVQHLYSPNMLVLLCRVTAHLKMRAPAVLSPTRSLLGLFAIVLLANLAAAGLHLYDFATGQNGTKGLVLDFVGQANPASFTRIFILDLAIFLLQLTTLLFSYVINYGPTLPKSDAFPYDDLLLPPAAPVATVTEADLDLEGGDALRQRRHGKGPRYQPVPGETWLGDDDDDPLLRSALPPRVFPDISRTHTRRSPVPLIFDVSPLHLVSLLFRLPAPVPPRLFSGGTPAATPPATPSQPPTQESLRELVNALAQAQAQAQAVAQGQARGDSVTATQRQAGVRRDETDGESESEEEGIETTDDDEESQLVPRQERRGGRRIPGDYWTSRATG